MLQIRTLDVLTCGGFVPYRDADDRPRLLDVMPLRRRRASKASRKLQRLALAALEAAVELSDVEAWRVWYDGPMAKFWDAWFAHGRELGLCMGDEGNEWKMIGEQIGDAAHRPGWRIDR